MHLKSIFLIFTLVFLSNISYSKEKVVTFASLNWQPYIGQNMNENGYVFQVVKKSFEAAGYRVQIFFYPWARAIELAKKGEVDGYFPEYFNESLKNEFLFSAPVDGGPIGFVKKKGRLKKFKAMKNQKDFSNIYDYKVGVVRGYTNTKAFDLDKKIRKDEVVNDLANLKRLFLERIDLTIMDPNVANYLMIFKMNGKYKNAYKELEVVEPFLEKKKLYICFSKNIERNKLLIRDFNRGLKLIKKNGIYQKILKDHHFKDGLWNVFSDK